MTVLPMYRICPKCRRRYNWNPDVGKMSCPYCKMNFVGKGLKIIKSIFKRKD